MIDFLFVRNCFFSSDKFREVEEYLGVNDHLKQGVSVDGGPKSGLEKQIEDAIVAGDTETADKLSDKLATRDVRIVCFN